MNTTPLPTPSTLPPDEPCATALDSALAGEPGILNARLDMQHELVLFDYDPRVVSDPDIVRIAQHVRPAVQERFATCTVRLKQQGGRACETCALALEREMSELRGVRRATASFRGGMLSVTYDGALVSHAQITQRAQDLGVVTAEPARAASSDSAPAASALAAARAWLNDERLEAVFTAVTLVAMVLAWLTEHSSAPAALAWGLYALAYLAGGFFGVKAGLESLRRLTVDVDLLMVLAALGAALVGAPFEGALLLFLFSLSNVLQAFALDRTRNAIRALMKLRPERALVRRNGETVMLPIDQVLAADVIVVRPGERVPLDGVVIEGESTLDQAAITGESIPVRRGPGERVLAGTINQRGALDVRVTHTAKDSTIARLIQLVEEAQSEKARTQRVIDTFEQYYAWGVIALTVAAVIVPITMLGEAFQPAFYRAMTIMVAASPCALVISTPASILSAIGNGARRGVLFKGGVHLERAAEIRVVAFDKTGTLTRGHPRVTDVRVLPGTGWTGDEDALLALAAAVEARSEHVLARATLEAARARKLELADAFAFQAATGKGVRAQVDGQDVRVGNLRYFEEHAGGVLDEAARAVAALEAEGKTCVVVARVVSGEGPGAGRAEPLGVVAFADELRPDAAQVVRELKELGIERVVMLTGDNERVAQAIAARAGVDEYYAGLLPEDKVRIVKELRSHYEAVAMVGDGVNDAPALATAALGIAMGAAGSDVALETADVVLMSDDLGNIPYVIALSRQTRRTLFINLGFAMAMIALMIVGIIAVNLPLPLAVIGHEGGTVLVSLNGLRLLLFKRQRAASV